MKTRMLITIATTIAAGALSASASAAPLAKSTVTIKVQNNEFSGKVKSPDKANCRKDRKVTLFKLLGPSPDRMVDSKVAFDGTSGSGKWSTGNTGAGDGSYYARVKKTSECRGDISPIVDVQF